MFYHESPSSELNPSYLYRMCTDSFLLVIFKCLYKATSFPFSKKKKKKGEKNNTNRQHLCFEMK